MLARHEGGEFLLRIEDTDTERNRPELTTNMLDMLQWLGLKWDGEPTYQSDRGELYRAAAAKLASDGRAYYCECTAEQVQARNKASGGKPGYDGFCRDRGLGPGPGRALRFRAPDDGDTRFQDLIRGEVVVENRNIEDFVLLRSNGNPTFLLANIVDDADMQITHVLRGEEHLNGTPKYLLLRDALGLDYQPVFAHLPLLVNEQRKKLSKRRDDVSVADYKARGFLPEAMRNYLALLGWGPPDGVEVRPIAEMVDLFHIEDVNPSPALFDIKKLTFVNGEWIRMLAVEDFVERSREFVDSPALTVLAPLAQERVKVLDELPAYFDWVDGPAEDQKSWDKAMKPPAADALDQIIEAYTDAPWTVEDLHQRFLDVAANLGVSPKKVDWAIRVATTGRTVGLPLFDVFVYLGRDETLERMRKARARLA